MVAMLTKMPVLNINRARVRASALSSAGMGIGSRQSPGVERSQVGPYLVNIAPLAIVQPRELSRRPNPHSGA